jgi:hypothetical protein
MEPKKPPLGKQGVRGFFLWRIFATWRHKKKGLANPTKGIFED